MQRATAAFLCFLVPMAAGLLGASAAAVAQKPPPSNIPFPSGAVPPAPPTPPNLAGKPPPLGAATLPTPQAPGAAGRLGPLPERRQVSTATGFAVAERRVMTNHHAVAGCAELRVRLPSGAEIGATVAAHDAPRDLALLTAAGDVGPALRFREGPPIRRGERVVTYGFPLANLLSSGPTLTTGEVSALAGLRDDQAQFQISAPVQPGNSGGPLLDMAGNVVGVVTSKLNAQRVAQATGDIPQNVNFAIKGAEAIAFLRRNGVQPRVREAGAPGELSAAEVGEIAHPSTVFIRCLR